VAKKRFTDADKWDDDEWFVELTPHHKLVWLYLCDKVDGATGTWKVQLKTLSRKTGTSLSLEEFRTAFAEKLVWINEELVWIPSFIVFQYKTLSAKNAAHRGIMARVVRFTTGLPLEGKAKELVDSFKTILQPAEDPQLTLIDPLRPSGDPQRGSTEGEGRGKGIGKGSSSREEGTGEKGARAVPAPSSLDQAEAAWRAALAHHKIPRDPRLDLPTLAHLIQRWGLERLLSALAGFRAERDSPNYRAAQNCVLRRLQKPDSFVGLETKGALLLQNPTSADGGAEYEEAWK
jgi:hypothetical protein